MRDLIEAIVRKVLEEHQISEKSKETLPKVFILLTEEPERDSEMSLIWEHIHQVVEEYEVTLAVCGCWLEVPEHIKAKVNVVEVDNYRKQEVPSTLEEADLLYLPLLSIGLLAKLAYTIDDDLVSKWTISMQLRGKPIVVEKDQLRLQNSNPQVISDLFVDKINNYLRTIQAEGITTTKRQSVLDTIGKQLRRQEDLRPLLLEKHVQAAWEKSEQSIHLPKKAIVTSLAKDKAKELGVKIYESQEKRGQS